MRFLLLNVIFFISTYAATTNTILFFYTSWCPACVQSVKMLNKIDERYKKHVTILGINLDDGVQRQNYLKDTPIHFRTKKMRLSEAKEYGVTKSVPVILVLNSKSQIIKKYYKNPNESVFVKLIDRLQSGYLANGTLPIEKRLDLWKMDRREK